jgi:protein-S-isoprenylcysteine O-methyltransferase Ste14
VSTLRLAISVIWVVFWVYWLTAAIDAKQGTRTRRTRPAGLLIVIVAFLLQRAFGVRALAVDQPIVQALGVVVFLSGLALAVWARVYLGGNWGMPMSEKQEPELVTSGPYHFVRHPIYSGILLGLVGTALATNLYWLIAVVVVGAYFIHSAKVEEGIMASSFPAAYRGYRARTKMLIPFVL